MNESPRFLAAAIEAAVPLLAGMIFTFKLVKSRKDGSSKPVFWLGPALLFFALLTAIRPLFGGESSSLVYQQSKRAIAARDVATLGYDDFLGSWVAVVDGQAIRRRLTYNFTFRPNGDCDLHYVSFNLDTSAEVKHYYDLQCEVAAGTLSHTAKNPSEGEQYEETHTITEFDGDTFTWSDNFVGPIRYQREK